MHCARVPHRRTFTPEPMCAIYTIVDRSTTAFVFCSAYCSGYGLWRPQYGIMKTVRREIASIQFVMHVKTTHENSVHPFWMHESHTNAPEPYVGQHMFTHQQNCKTINKYIISILFGRTSWMWKCSLCASNTICIAFGTYFSLSYGRLLWNRNSHCQWSDKHTDRWIATDKSK